MTGLHDLPDEVLDSIFDLLKGTQSEFAGLRLISKKIACHIFRTRLCEFFVNGFGRIFHEKEGAVCFQPFQLLERSDCILRVRRMSQRCFGALQPSFSKFHRFCFDECDLTLVTSILDALPPVVYELVVTPPAENIESLHCDVTFMNSLAWFVHRSGAHLQRLELPYNEEYMYFILAQCPQLAQLRLPLASIDLPMRTPDAVARMHTLTSLEFTTETSLTAACIRAALLASPALARIGGLPSLSTLLFPETFARVFPGLREISFCGDVLLMNRGDMTCIAAAYPSVLSVDLWGANINLMSLVPAPWNCLQTCFPQLKVLRMPPMPPYGAAELEWVPPDILLCTSNMSLTISGLLSPLMSHYRCLRDLTVTFVEDDVLLRREFVAFLAAMSNLQSLTLSTQTVLRVPEIATEFTLCVLDVCALTADSPMRHPARGLARPLALHIGSDCIDTQLWLDRAAPTAESDAVRVTTLSLVLGAGAGAAARLAALLPFFPSLREVTFAVREPRSPLLRSELARVLTESASLLPRVRALYLLECELEVEQICVMIDALPLLRALGVCSPPEELDRQAYVDGLLRARLDKLTYFGTTLFRDTATALRAACPWVHIEDLPYLH